MELKLPTTYDEQLKKLEDRNCLVVDPAFCKTVLQRINYYRFSAYFLPFRDENGNYRDGTSFHQVYRIYEFDRKMRQILFGAIEQVELYLRTQISYFHAHKYGPHGYMDAANFSKKHDHNKFDRRFQEEVKHNKSVLYVKHHLEKYDGKFPLWVATELFPFGMLSCFFADMTTQDKKRLAKDMYQTTPANVDSWLRCCTDLRNICAHHGRLYFRVFSAVPATPGGFPITLGRRLLDNIVAIKFLYPDAMRWNNEILPAITALVEEYSRDIRMSHIGFRENWESLLRKN